MILQAVRCISGNRRYVDTSTRTAQNTRPYLYVSQEPDVTTARRRALPTSNRNKEKVSYAWRREALTGSRSRVAAALARVRASHPDRNGQGRVGWSPARRHRRGVECGSHRKDLNRRDGHQWCISN